jgi:hypothetical protein
VRGTTEGINLVASVGAARTSKKATRSSSRPWSTTPTSCPGRCCARKRAEAARHPHQRPRRAAAGGIRKAAQPAHQAGGRRARFQRARHHQPGGRDHRAWRTATGAWRSSMARRPAPHMKVDVQALDAISTRSPATRWWDPPASASVRQGGAAERHAALSGRRRHDQARSLSRRPLTDLPYKFEAGTPNIAGGIGLGAAVDYINASGSIASPLTNTNCWSTARKRLERIPGLRIIGTAREKASVLSFVMEGIHPHDIGTVLDRRESRCAPAIIARSR